VLKKDPKDRLTAALAMQHPWIKGVNVKSNKLDMKRLQNQLGTNQIDRKNDFYWPNSLYNKTIVDVHLR